MSDGNGKNIFEWFRVITPILVTIACFMIANLLSTTSKIDDKLFKHLTNDEIHCPRTNMVSRSEFDVVTKMRDKQIQDIRDMIREQFDQIRLDLRIRTK